MFDYGRVLEAIPSVDQIERVLLSGLCKHLIDIGDCDSCLGDRLQHIFRENLDEAPPRAPGVDRE